MYKKDAIEPYNKGKNIFIDQLGFYLAGPSPAYRVRVRETGG